MNRDFMMNFKHHHIFFQDGTTFWQEGYKSEYGQFFLNWYSQKLIEHGKNVLGIARKTFPYTHIAAKIAGIHWQYLNDTRYSEIAKMFLELNKNISS